MINKIRNKIELIYNIGIIKFLKFKYFKKFKTYNMERKIITIQNNIKRKKILNNFKYYKSYIPKKAPRKEGDYASCFFVLSSEDLKKLDIGKENEINWKKYNL